MVLSCTMTRKTKLLSALRRELRISDGLVRRLKPLDAFRVNGESAHTNRLLEPGDVVSVTIEETAPDFPAEDGRLDVLYEDECLIAVDKPAGILVHPSFSRQTGTLANRLLGYYQRTGQACAVHVLTRLDRDTMGVVIFAKNAWAHWLLMEELDAGRVEKIYEALTLGGPDSDEGLIDLPIAKRPNPSLLRFVSPVGKPAQTRFQVLERLPPYLPGSPPICRLELRPLTGRTHQLRVHCSYMGFPILGDPQYQGSESGDQGSGTPACVSTADKAAGSDFYHVSPVPCHLAPEAGGRGFFAPFRMTGSEAASGQQLVARRVSLDHPLTGARMTFVSKIELRTKK